MRTRNFYQEVSVSVISRSLGVTESSVHKKVWDRESGGCPCTPEPHRRKDSTAPMLHYTVYNLYVNVTVLSV